VLLTHPCLVVRLKCVELYRYATMRTMKTLRIYQVTFFRPRETEQFKHFRKSRLMTYVDYLSCVGYSALLAPLV